MSPDTVGLVIVSHSATLAEGVVELARQMGGEGLRIEAAGGMADPPGEIGTDPMVVMEAIERVAGPAGVLVLMDLGSAVMSAEMAAEMVSADGPVQLCAAPLVEGAVAAAALAGAGAPIEEVAREARGALAMKTSALGEDEPAGGDGAAADADAGPPPDAEADLHVPNALGLHARPAARIVEVAAGFDASVTLRDETTGRGPVDARSLSGLVTLGTRQGHRLHAAARGPQAQAALDALRALAEEGYGDGVAAGGASAAVVAAGAGDVGAGATTTSGAGGAGAASTAGAGGTAPVEPPAPGTVLHGVPVSPGIAIGPAAGGATDELPDDDGEAGEPAQERERLDGAVAATDRDLEATRARIAERGHEAEAAIFDAHRRLLADPALTGAARAGVERGEGAPAAWRAAVAEVAGAFAGLDDPLLRERAADVRDVGARVLRALHGLDPAAGPAGAAAGILVAADLAPGDAAALDPEVVTGIALARGGATSHAAILARALGIPTVAGLGPAVLAVAPGTAVVLDGQAGTLEVAPGDDVVEARRAAQAAAEQRRAHARSRAHEPATTADGVTLAVHANAGTVRDAHAAVEQGADGIGLLRTEFLFLDREEAPSEEEQRETYAEIARALEGRPLTIRTLDAGADKPLRFIATDPEDNPFLGVRGIRLSLLHPELFAAQLRAIAAVAKDHPVRLMFPMVGTLEELRAGRAAVQAARAATGAPEFPVGAMVEVPALPLAAERFAREAAFFSVGTNDLTQYTLAAERGNPGVAALGAGTPPAVLRLVDLLVAGAQVHGRPVGVCGELAGDPAAAVLLAGLGVSSLSAAAGRVAEVKQALRDVRLADARELARQALDAEDAAAVAALAAPLLTG